MRTKDENKVKAIKQAVIELCDTIGLANMTTAKVAKEAGVSPATIYLYYQDKTDLLSRLYEEVKDDLHRGLAGAITAAGDDVTAQLRAMLQFSVDRAREFPKESHFVSTLWTSQELLDDAAKASGNTAPGPLLTLYQRLQADDKIVDAPIPVLAAFASVPTLILQTADDDAASLTQAIDLVVKALMK
ncbi:TetR/AcrR family transcriptional regulator [Lactiplantibacillus mudanjiangensis]|uniref:HTH tetR-type domain-containing protein n=1 Tax=Lactiplantibacillus mudanjiangensis TaxID=1296538 RepID=A0A660E8M2_9LACO|nr:TetR/AcrR family transcriptional regulator [Lactiplantibacillus mudanjiangensis]VDG20415.1 hypothetical protein [Lactobacillus paracollinoides] [Lactiplantibacillus mudanjiangensis]VDG25222.1 hypothetical protein [Lactobacillus paracollinoides] [Lactiplantibacillus mudanjiangensis]VDG30383.1 hypothetical protein [Lactobacillus paracollinoides] [Lactiplantibacillus mudanjiangensis]VDG30834.1 hypothetical protein [Lactobacillus paracollinoides] [Lactiplantibacillus mudanjiangensis]